MKIAPCFSLLGAFFRVPSPKTIPCRGTAVLDASTPTPSPRQQSHETPNAEDMFALLHALLLKKTVERGMPPTAWMISNRQPYGEEIDHPDSLLLAGPQILGRFTTTPLAKKGGKVSGGSATNAGCCNITRLGPGACVETAEAAGRIKHHLEVVLDRRLQMLVADFTRDDRDRLWFLQVRFGGI